MKESASPHVVQPLQSHSAPPTVYAASSHGGSPHGSLRRKTTTSRRQESRAASRGPSRAPSRAATTYDEEEGYVSGGEYDNRSFELHKIRIKVSLWGLLFLFFVGP
jgi:hypothetical protein